jgi:ectoine hydroxylase-related dioxygenase (phytanoyl-CoA dioxygenase family)
MSFEDDGFVVMEGALSADQLATARAFVDARNGERAPERGERFFLNLTNRHPFFRELVQHPRLLAFADGLLGSDCILNATCARTIWPGAEAQTLHRDTSAWWPSMPWLPVPLGISVAWPLDDLTDDNGATRCVPGSHRREAIDRDARDVPMIAPAGSCVAFDLRLVHRGGANRSSAPRRVVFASYVRSWVKPHTDHRRSTDRAIVEGASPTLVRLFGFQNQSCVDTNDDRSLVVAAPGATDFYGNTPAGFVD